VLGRIEQFVLHRRLAKLEDIAPIVVPFASDDASFITGQVISVSGGLPMGG
jgi:2-hydroxycyclohexanecarboxyl-CoA dehydrogenase